MASNRKSKKEINTNVVVENKKSLTVADITEVILLINSIQGLIDQHPALVEFLKTLIKSIT